jgi:hypothetical protein
MGIGPLGVVRVILRQMMSRFCSWIRCKMVVIDSWSSRYIPRDWCGMLNRLAKKYATQKFLFGNIYFYV